jgi:hypothetical protein
MSSPRGSDRAGAGAVVQGARVPESFTFASSARASISVPFTIGRSAEELFFDCSATVLVGAMCGDHTRMPGIRALVDLSGWAGKTDRKRMSIYQTRFAAIMAVPSSSIGQRLSGEFCPDPRVDRWRSHRPPYLSQAAQGQSVCHCNVVSDSRALRGSGSLERRGFRRLTRKRFYKLSPDVILCWS